MKKFCFVGFILFILSGNALLHGQEKKTREQREQEHAALVQQWIKSQEYRFIAQQAIPMSGRSLSITPDYGLSVGKDTISAHLPYFGKAYIAPMDNTNIGIEFESHKFEYTVESAKKGGWQILIVPADGQKRYELILRVTESGSANLIVNDDTRQSISFYGYIDAQERKE